MAHSLLGHCCFPRCILWLLLLALLLLAAAATFHAALCCFLCHFLRPCHLLYCFPWPCHLPLHVLYHLQQPLPLHMAPVTSCIHFLCCSPQPLLLPPPPSASLPLPVADATSCAAPHAAVSSHGCWHFPHCFLQPLPLPLPPPTVPATTALAPAQPSKHYGAPSCWTVHSSFPPPSI